MYQSMTEPRTSDPRSAEFPLARELDPDRATQAALDPFGSDPAVSRSERRVAFVVVIAVLLGIAAGSLAYVLRPHRATPAAAPVATGEAWTDPEAGLPTASPTASASAVSGVRAGAVAGGSQTRGSSGTVSTAGSGKRQQSGQQGTSGGTSGGTSSGTSGGTSGDTSGGTSGGTQGDGTEGDDGSVDGDPADDGGDDLPTATLVAHVSLLSPGSGKHKAGTPLMINASVTHPLTGKALPGYYVHWTVTKAGHVLRSGSGKTGSVPGYLMTSGSYHVHVEYASKGLAGADDASVSVPFELKPSPKPSPKVQFPAEITGVKPTI